MKFYRKKPIVITAFQLPPSGVDVGEDFHQWCADAEFTDFESDRDEGLLVRTLEGTMRAEPGDWIIKGVKGEFYPCKPDVFAASYDDAEAPLPERMTLTCVYCGKEYPPGTPAHGSEVLTAHIRVCEKHPMRKVEADRKMLRAALVGLVLGPLGEGTTKTESAFAYSAMEAQLRVLPMPAEDKATTIDAIHALVATLP